MFVHAILVSANSLQHKVISYHTYVIMDIVTVQLNLNLSWKWQGTNDQLFESISDFIFSPPLCHYGHCHYWQGLDQAEQLCTLCLDMYSCLYSIVQLTWRQPRLSRGFVDTFGEKKLEHTDSGVCRVAFLIKNTPSPQKKILEIITYIHWFQTVGARIPKSMFLLLTYMQIPPFQLFSSYSGHVL